jgi:hypothetical protein
MHAGKAHRREQGGLLNIPTATLHRRISRAIQTLQEARGDQATPCNPPFAPVTVCTRFQCMALGGLIVVEIVIWAAGCGIGRNQG